MKVSKQKIPEQVKTIKKGENKKKRKSSSKGGNIPTQKNKITNFFKVIPGLSDLGWVRKNVGSGPAILGVGEGSDRISDFRFQNEFEPCTVEAEENNHMDIAVDFYCSTDEELQLEMHLD